MRLLIFILVVLACGCIQSQQVVKKVYVCSDMGEVDNPQKCLIFHENASIRGAVTLVLPTSTSLTAPKPDASQGIAKTTSTTLDECAGKSVYDARSCEAFKAKNASICPFQGLEYRWETLSTSVFSSLGKDGVSGVRRDRILDVFLGNETCVMRIINSYDSPKECEKSPYRQLCLERFIVKADDPASCEAIKQGPMQQGCYYSLILAKNNLQACMRYPEYDGCLVRHAAEKNDTGMCRRVYLKRSRDYLVPGCIDDVNMRMCLVTGKPDGDCCATILEGRRGICYAEKLRATNDTRWCMKDAGYGRFEQDGSCLALMAGRLKDPDICDEIESVTWHDECLRQMMSATSNTTLCEKITDDQKRRNCKRGG